MEPTPRMVQALAEKSIFLDDGSFAKLQTTASDTSKPCPGQNKGAYQSLTKSVAHIVHCAWPMSITHSVLEFERQFTVIRELLDTG